MFGIGDRIYTLSKRYRKFREINVDWKPEISIYDRSNCDWYCFVPQNVARIHLLKRGLIPARENVYIYKIYSLSIIKNDTDRTLNSLQEIYGDAMMGLHVSLKKNRSVSFLGVSLGNVLAIRAAGESGSRIERIVSIAGGGKLGLSAWDSILTSDIARQSGCSSAEEYEKRLSAFSPVNYIDRVIADKITIFLGTNDLLIPFKQGQELALAFKERARAIGASFDYKEYIGADHSATIFLSAISELVKRKFNLFH